jgi:hypothetical protein
MISKELLSSIELLFNGTWHLEPVRFWLPWIVVSEEEAYDMKTIIFRVIDKAGANPIANPEQTSVPIREQSASRKVAELTNISPWSGLLMLTEDGKSITLNKNLSAKDREEVFRILYEYSRVIV